MNEVRSDVPEGAVVTYSPALRIDIRAGGGQDLVALAKSRAIDPAVFDEFELFTFGGVMSNNRWDAHDTRMAPSSLKNYADEAAAGVSYLVGHDTRSMPVGQTLTGAFTGAQGNGIATTRADVYMINDPGTAPLIAKIRAGIVRDQSIGFFGGQWICTICGHDMQDWMSRDGCPHLLGMAYTPRDEAGKQKGDAVVARADIEDAHLAELSGVYDGSTPGAMIDKARALAGDGMLDTRMRELVQVRYKTRLPEYARPHPAPDPGRANSKPTREDAMDPEARIAELETRTKELETQLGGRQQALDALRAAIGQADLPADHPGKSDPLAAARWLVEERARLSPLADDGRAYRADLIEDARKEGIRAHGKEFREEMWAGVLARSSIDEIKEFRAMWAREAAGLFRGGRQTTEGEQRPAAASQDSAIPAEAYRSGR